MTRHTTGPTVTGREKARRALLAHMFALVTFSLLAGHVWLLTGRSLFTDGAALHPYLWAVAAGPLIGRAFAVLSIALVLIFEYEMLRNLYAAIAAARSDSDDGVPPGCRSAFVTLTAGLAASVIFVGRATAQYGGATDVVCSAGGAQLFSLAVGAVALYYTAKGGLKLISGFDDKKSRSSMQQKEGNEKMASGAKTMAAGVIGPGLIAASLDYLGVNLGCLSFDIGILAILPV